LRNFPLHQQLSELPPLRFTPEWHRLPPLVRSRLIAAPTCGREDEPGRNSNANPAYRPLSISGPTVRLWLTVIASAAICRCVRGRYRSLRAWRAKQSRYDRAPRGRHGTLAGASR
jgi:hypothetical protein